MQKESPHSAAKPYCHQLHQPSSALISPDLTGPNTTSYVGQCIVSIASSSSGSIPLIPTVPIAHFAFHPLTHPITTEAPSLFAAQPRGTERTDPPGDGTLVGAETTRSGGFPGGFSSSLGLLYAPEKPSSLEFAFVSGVTCVRYCAPCASYRTTLCVYSYVKVLALLLLLHVTCRSTI